MPNIVGTSVRVRDLFAAALAGRDLEVLTGWQQVNSSGAVLTVGLMDPSMSLSDVSQPMGRIEAAVMGAGFDSHDVERAAIYCQLMLPGAGDPDEPLAEAEGVLSDCRAALRTSGVPGAHSAVIAETNFFLTNAATGFGAVATFTIVTESYV